MRTRIVTVLLGAALAFLLVTHPVVAEAARKITGRDIKNNSVTSADIRNGSLTGKDVKNQGLTGGDIKIGTLISADVKDNNLRGKDVRDDTLTGADVDESTLGRVPSAATADALSVLPSGESQSGMYSMAGGET
ncbi:MAG: hypothetical protein CMJ44_13845, partial [Pimelobacter sp.]|nr:hypothetical protein [Pimelobacter sp.]